jgi:hypothetical protein
MTSDELRMYEEMENKQYNPCFYCKYTLTCGVECAARWGFNNIITAKLNDCITRKYSDEYWQDKFSANADEFHLPWRKKGKED